MLTNWCLSESTREALAEIEQAKWEHAHTMQCYHGISGRVSDEQWAARGSLNEEGRFRVAFDSDDSCEFTPDAIFEAERTPPALAFRVRGYKAVVEIDGTVRIGCQIHPIADFLPGGNAEFVSPDVRNVPATDRQALVEAVQARLVEYARSNSKVAA